MKKRMVVKLLGKVGARDCGDVTDDDAMLKCHSKLRQLADEIYDRRRRKTDKIYKISGCVLLEPEVVTRLAHRKSAVVTSSHPVVPPVTSSSHQQERTKRKYVFAAQKEIDERNRGRSSKARGKPPPSPVDTPMTSSHEKLLRRENIWSSPAPLLRHHHHHHDVSRFPVIRTTVRHEPSGVGSFPSWQDDERGKSYKFTKKKKKKNEEDENAKEIPNFKKAASNNKKKNFYLTKPQHNVKWIEQLHA